MENTLTSMTLSYCDVLFISLLSCLSCTVCLTFAYVSFFVPFFTFDFHLYANTYYLECFEFLYIIQEPPRNQHSILLCNMSESFRCPFSNGFIHWNMLVFKIDRDAFQMINCIHVIMHAFTITFLQMFMPCR